MFNIYVPSWKAKIELIATQDLKDRIIDIGDLIIYPLGMTNVAIENCNL